MPLQTRLTTALGIEHPILLAPMDLVASGKLAAAVSHAGGDDTLRSILFNISRRNIWPQPYTGRVIRNAHAERWYGHEAELLERQEEEAQRYAEARERGDFDVAAVIAGEAVGLIHDAPPAAEVVIRIIREAEGLLSRGRSNE